MSNELTKIIPSDNISVRHSGEKHKLIKWWNIKCCDSRELHGLTSLWKENEVAYGKPLRIRSAVVAPVSKTKNEVLLNVKVVCYIHWFYTLNAEKLFVIFINYSKAINFYTDKVITSDSTKFLFISMPFWILYLWISFIIVINSLYLTDKVLNIR